MDIRVLDIKSAAKIYSFPERALRSMCIQGRLKATKPNGKNWSIPVVELDRFFNVKEFETVCKSTDCVYNDTPICKINSHRNPIELGLRGKCLNYLKK